MANDKHSPSILWAERNDKLYITIDLEDCKDVKIKFEETKCIFSAKGGPDQKDYEVTMEFFKEINPEKSSYVVADRQIPMIIVKKQSGPYWGKMLAGKKAHWLKTDFNKWRDEDDSDFDEADDMQFENMMQKMGNFNTGGDGAAMGEHGEMEEEDQDSDDDELPDLQ